MPRRLAAPLAALALLAAAAPPLAAQHSWVGAWIYDRTDDFGSPDQRFRLSCGTGTVSTSGDILLASVGAVTKSFACAGAEAYADATGGALRFRTRVTGPGEMPRPFDPPYAPGAGGGFGRVAQAWVYFDDVLTFASPFAGKVRFAYELTGERRETPGTPPAGAGPTATSTGASVTAWWGVGDDDFVNYNAPLGVSDVHGFFDLPVVGATQGYALGLGGYARLSTSLTTPAFALVGEALSDFSHTLRITKLTVLDQAGADVTAATTFSSRVYQLAPDGTVTGGLVVAAPEPAALALVETGLLALGLVRRRRG
jgi:hypothetical protein